MRRKSKQVKRRKRVKKPEVRKDDFTHIKASMPENLQAYILEANEVQQMTQHPGWVIIERDLKSFRNTIIDKLVYSSPKSREFDENRVLFVGIDKILALVNDYNINREKAIEELEKLNNPDVAIQLDVDNE